MSDEFFKEYVKALKQDKTYGERPEVFYHGFRRAVNDKKKLVNEEMNQKLIHIQKIISEGKQTLIFTNWLEFGVDILEDKFDESGITYGVISGDIIASSRLEIVNNFNNKKFQVLIITSAGSEGLDLKEVRNVIVLDPVWNPASLEQIIGRAVRFKSHVKLPKEEQIVDVYLMTLDTPDGAYIPSGDKMLYGIINNKQLLLDQVIEMLKEASI